MFRLFRWSTLPAVVAIGAFVLVLSGPFSALSDDGILAAVTDPAIRSSVLRTVWTSVLSAGIATALAAPTAWHASQEKQWRVWTDTIVEVVLAMPPMVIGACLLLLFRRGLLVQADESIGVSFETTGVVVAQSVVATALAIRLLRTVFDSYPRDAIEVARVCGARPAVVFWSGVLPAIWRELAGAAALSWARAFGEFGPVLMFAGVTRFETEVLSTSIHLELSDGRLEVAAALSVGMMLVAAVAAIGVNRLTRRTR